MRFFNFSLTIFKFPGNFFLFVFTFIFLSDFLIAQSLTGGVKIIGEMRNVMWKGQLFGNINLDTISNKTNLFGLGPVEFLSGELLIIDGISYKSTVVANNSISVEKTFNVSAPFFAYSNISKWFERILPDSIKEIKDLEIYLDTMPKNSTRPFIFKISGMVDHAIIHVVNLPIGLKVNSPEQAHKGQKKYQIKSENVEIIGFFSTEHQGVFTHHDTFLNMHLITNNKKMMGHLDKAYFTHPVKLYLPF